MIQIPRRVYYLKVLICPSFLLYLNSCKMADRLRDTCLIVGLRDIICCLLYGFMAIFHGNANSSHADHAEVILPVSKAHGGLSGDSQTCGKTEQRSALISSLRVDLEVIRDPDRQYAI